MADDFNENLIKDSRDFESLVQNSDIRENMLRIRTIYPQLQSQFDKIQEKFKLDEIETFLSEKDCIMIKTFFSEMKKIPFNSLSDSQILSLLYNYNIDQEYVENIQRILESLINRN